MRWNRPNTENNGLQASTSYTSHHEGRAPNLRRRQKVHHMERTEDEIHSAEELFFAKQNTPIDSQKLFSSGSHVANHPQKVAPTASVIVFAFALSGILLIFLLFYFLAKICSPQNEDDFKDQQAESISSAAVGRRTVPTKMTVGVSENAKSVLYPRRIYELQAEEGCYSSLPSMKTSEIKDNTTTSSPIKKRHFDRLVRKLTTNSAPPPEFYTPSNSPRFSTCSET